jgi:hypothetical protein
VTFCAQKCKIGNIQEIPVRSEGEPMVRDMSIVVVGFIKFSLYMIALGAFARYMWFLMDIGWKITEVI